MSTVTVRKQTEIDIVKKQQISVTRAFAGAPIQRSRAGCVAPFEFQNQCPLTCCLLFRGPPPVAVPGRDDPAVRLFKREICSKCNQDSCACNFTPTYSLNFTPVAANPECMLKINTNLVDYWSFYPCFSKPTGISSQIRNPMGECYYDWPTANKVPAKFEVANNLWSVASLTNCK